MAVGATRWQVLRLILSQGLRLAVVGIALGAIAAAMAGRLLESMLYGISSVDPVAFAGAGALLMLVALAANLMPARSAMRIDPLRALRSE
jgi:putative ABC transport system permease protein